MFASAVFEQSVEEVGELIDDAVTRVAYMPRLGPDDLAAIGLAMDDIEAIQEYFVGFGSGSIVTIVPALPVYAAVLGISGPRRRDDG